MKINVLRSLSFGIFMLLIACGENTEVVESGTYEGTIKKVEADNNEIYVSTADDKTLELYFTEETALTQNGSPVEFSVLQEGQNVMVEVEKVGKRLDPISVEILD